MTEMSYNLVEIFSEANVSISVNELLTKKDGCGPDGIYVSQYQSYWDINGDLILESIYDGTYQPGKVQEVKLLKKNGKKRIISKHGCTDRVILSVIKRDLDTRFEETFSSCCYAYRPEKGTIDAVNQAIAYIKDGYEWVAEIDIEDFFDNIHLDKLENTLREAGLPKDYLELIHKFLHMTIQSEDGEKIKNKGLIQGSATSPILSNIYMRDFDRYFAEQCNLCRYADNINVYCKSQEEADKITSDIEEYLRKELHLKLNKAKCGVYPAINRRYLGYEFYKTKNPVNVVAQRIQRENRGSYAKWNHSAIERIDKNYHIINDGIISRKDYTVLFENDEKKSYLPVETCGMLNVYSNIFFDSSFFEFANKKNLKISIYDRYGEYVGGFVTANHFLSTKTMLKQAEIYQNSEKRLDLARKIEIASIHNQRENLRYFLKHNKNEELKQVIDTVTDAIGQMKKCQSVQDMMLIEARAKQKYLQCFDIMVNDEDFPFEKRTRRPPKNAINALISFGNTFLYRRIASEIYKTSLDIRIGFAHAANNRSESLNLDIAEIFKPIIVDRTIFTTIHRKQIVKDRHFQMNDDGGVYLNNEGKRVFIREMEDKIYSKISMGDRPMTYDAIMRNEIQKLLRCIMNDEKYKPFKYT